jgi:hypothetical protein
MLTIRDDSHQHVVASRLGTTAKFRDDGAALPSIRASGRSSARGMGHPPRQRRAPRPSDRSASRRPPSHPDVCAAAWPRAHSRPEYTRAPPIRRRSPRRS